MPCWLVKTEPSAYAFADLLRDRKTRWDGVTNALAQRHLREMRPGDEVVVYHSGEKAAVGLARVSRGPSADPGDPAGKRVAVELAAGEALPAPVALESLRAEPCFEGSPLLRQGRLSVLPLTPAQARTVKRLGRGRQPSRAAALHSEKRSRTSTREAPGSPGARTTGALPSR